MAWFAIVYTQFLFETTFSFFWGESSSLEQSMTSSMSRSSSMSGIDFHSGGLFSSEFLDSRGKAATSVSARRGVGLRCKHAERAI